MLRISRLAGVEGYYPYTRTGDRAQLMADARAVIGADSISIDGGVHVRYSKGSFSFERPECPVCAKRIGGAK